MRERKSTVAGHPGILAARALTGDAVDPTRTHGATQGGDFRTEGLYYDDTDDDFLDAFRRPWPS